MDTAKDNIASILKIGIATEMNGERFYRRFAERVTREETKNKLESLASDEARHRKILVDIYRGYFGTEPTDIPKEGIGVFEKVLKEDRLSDDVTVPGLLNIAIEAEASSRDYYMEGEKNTKDEEIKKVFGRLADEEDGHFNLLTAEKSALAGIDWYSIGSSGEFEH